MAFFRGRSQKPLKTDLILYKECDDVKCDTNPCTSAEICCVFQLKALFGPKQRKVVCGCQLESLLLWMHGAAGVRTAVIVTLEEESSTATEKRTHQNTARLHG